MFGSTCPIVDWMLSYAVVTVPGGIYQAIITADEHGNRRLIIG
jgi:hypothetical protein